ncbi:hypothetical protein I4641_23725 [Waterburya agarophytonicola K14]|uniref:Uncharacterized protein n=2 Tax=Waterburya TaxID=2886915 RepID=A0A964C0Q5_9CYAN|nr:hypothetical protein [Waterburya agarophytonicola KI4]
MAWTKKHDNFALATNLSESQTLVLRDILRKAKLNEPCEIEVDVRPTNKWIGKHRLLGEFHRKTICNAIPALDEKSQGMLTILKRYSPWVYKILVRPLSFLEKIESANCASCPKSPTGNPMFDAASKERAHDLLLQNISKLDSLLSKLGMKCNSETLHRMWRYAGRKMDNVIEAVNHMLAVNRDKVERSTSFECKGKGIASPIGWLHDCLKFNRYLDWSQEIELPLYVTPTDLLSNLGQEPHQT